MSSGSHGLRWTLRVLVGAVCFCGAARAEELFTWETSLTPALVRPKAKVRDGTPTLAPSDIHSGSDLSLDENVLGLGCEAALRIAGHPFPFEPLGGKDTERPSDRAGCIAGHRISLGFWWTAADGDGELQEEKNVGGSTYAEGTPVDSRLEWTSLRLQYLYAFPFIKDTLKVDVGLALDRTTFKSEMDFPSGEANMSIWGIYPSPQVAVELKLLDELSIRGGMGGFRLIKTPNGDTVVSENVEYRAAVVGRWDWFTVEAGYYLFHLHLEENADKPEQDAVHMRVRSLYLSLMAEF
jgi:hypothetical protein